MDNDLAPRIVKWTLLSVVAPFLAQAVWRRWGPATLPTPGPLFWSCFHYVRGLGFGHPYEAQEEVPEWHYGSTVGEIDLNAQVHSVSQVPYGFVQTPWGLLHDDYGIINP